MEDKRWNDQVEEGCNENKQLRILLKKVYKGAHEISLEGLTEFIRRKQGKNVKDDKIEKIYNGYKTNENGFTKGSFIRYLLSPYNSIVDPDKKYTNMKLPLNNYYINSSHNTYLTNSQIGFKTASTEGYVKALINGCRCIEIDCHNGPLGSPVVCHWGFTSIIPFSEVIHTIKKYSFHITPYPLIISLEIKCNLSQRKKMINILTSSFGTSLAFEDELDMKNLPSPESLKYKVILRGKLSRSYHPPPSHDFFLYLRTIRIKNIDSLDSSKCNNSFSLSECKSIDLIKRSPSKYFNLNKSFLIRVFPSFVRIFSSNFNPLPHWSSGCSMVALNFQTPDFIMNINSALFEINNHSGYVPKLDFSIPLSHLTSLSSPKILLLSFSPLCVYPLPPSLLPSSNLSLLISLSLPMCPLIHKFSLLSNPSFSNFVSWNDTLFFTVPSHALAFVTFSLVDRTSSPRSLASRTFCLNFFAPGFRSLSLSSSLPSDSLMPSLLLLFNSV